MAKRTKSELAQIAADNASMLSGGTLRLLLQRIDCNAYGNPRYSIRFLAKGPESGFMATIFTGLTKHKVTKDQVIATCWDDPKQVAENFEKELRANGVTAQIEWYGVY